MALKMAAAHSCVQLPSSFSWKHVKGCVQNRTSVSFAVPAQCYPSIQCGRGDRRTKKGKRFNHSFGNARPRNKKKGRGLPSLPLPPRPPRKDDPFDDGEKIEIEIDEFLF
ncbi:small ribosomal subunit protein bTHXc [Cryptomeria japonica]|uniref:small ribosomal subunit protein bTHXc n=1 Tax=Cryptomeria japonica TaxID=3369 RepID=UPI0027DAABA1|nr:small ribosomal subunit protein bTHXc [Cryptomeria japonica]